MLSSSVTGLRCWQKLPPTSKELKQQLDSAEMDRAIVELQKLYRSLIPFSLLTVRGGFQVQIGGTSARPAARVFTRTIDEAAEWLREQAKHRHPESDYARRLLIN